VVLDCREVEDQPGRACLAGARPGFHTDDRSTEMIEYLGSVISDAMLGEMRAWIADCAWKDADDLATLTDREVVQGVARHYDGGVQAFLAS
jgi:hypothetical protein